MRYAREEKLEHIIEFAKNSPDEFFAKNDEKEQEIPKNTSHTL